MAPFASRGAAKFGFKRGGDSPGLEKNKMDKNQTQELAQTIIKPAAK